jgi:hypothetical protein
MEVEIKNRVEVIGDGEKDFVMVDLIIDDKIIDSGNNPISSYSFWEDIEQVSQRALYRIKNQNPKMRFDFNLSTLGMSEDDKEARFVAYLKNQKPELDVDMVMSVINKELSEIKKVGPDDNHPNPFMKFPIDSQMVKAFILNIIEQVLIEKTK